MYCFDTNKNFTAEEICNSKLYLSADNFVCCSDFKDCPHNYRDSFGKNADINGSSINIYKCNHAGTHILAEDVYQRIDITLGK